MVTPKRGKIKTLNQKLVRIEPDDATNWQGDEVDDSFNEAFWGEEDNCWSKIA